jgi:hypothetical protein
MITATMPEAETTTEIGMTPGTATATTTETATMPETVTMSATTIATGREGGRKTPGPGRRTNPTK